MPRQLRSTTTFDELEDEILFTRAAVKADPDAKDFEPMTAGWLDLVDAVRVTDRAMRSEVAEADAARAVANGRLDHACVLFGDDLHTAVKKDRKAARWLQFFNMAVSRFIRIALGREVQIVRGWLIASKDPVLEKHRAPLEAWSNAADAALIRTRGTAAHRGEVWQQREELAESLTRERDGLHDALSQRARERDLPRDGADLFFRIETRSREEADEAASGAPPTGTQG